MSQEKNKSMKIFHNTNDNIENSIFNSHLGIEEEMLSLYRSLNLLLPDSTNKVIQFISSYEGEGATTLVRELARIIVIKLKKVVLILYANCTHCSQELSSYIEKVDYGLDEVIKEDKSLNGALYQVKDTSLYVSLISKNQNTLPYVFDNYKIKNFWEKLKQRFDIILIDSPPVTASHDGLILCSMVDGIVLVFEADKTQWTVAKNVKKEILKSGGKILGIVFNKKKNYIPDLINKRL